MRYLGVLCQTLKSMGKGRAQHLEGLCVSEMLVRAAKVQLRRHLSNSGIHHSAEISAYFFNCFLVGMGEGG